MTRFEIRRWLRSRRLLIVVAAFAFSGLTAPLVSAYAREIFGTLTPADNLRVTIEDPTWQDSLSSYLQNSSQLALVFACYLAAWGCSLGSDERLRIYYRSRVRRSSEIFGPRLVVSASCVLAGTVVGAALALYETVVLFDETVVSRAVGVLALQAAGLVTVAMLAACLAVATNAPVMSAGLVYAVVLVADFVRSAELVSRWSPTVLVRPTELLEDGRLVDYARPLTVAAVLLLAAVTTVLVRQVRELPGPPAAAAAVPAGDGRRLVDRPRVEHAE